MKKTILLFFLVITNNVKSQTIDETVIYINSLLKSSTYTAKFEGVTYKYENVYDSLSLDKKGRLDCFRILKVSNSDIAEKKLRFYVYLKAIAVNYKSDYSNYYIMNLKCTQASNCFGGLSVERDNISFSINTATNRDKLYNAFSHLLKISLANIEYYEKDPFSN